MTGTNRRLDRALAAPHRPLFVLAGVWALVVVARTAWSGGAEPVASPLGSLAGWHAYETVFGFGAAGFAGYALTAMRSWSARGGPSPPVLLLLIAAWILARLTAWGALGPDPRLTLPAGVAFLTLVSAFLAGAALSARSPRGAVQALAAVLLTGSQVAILLGAAEPRLPVLGFALLLSVVGGRMVAGFTRARLGHRPAQIWRFTRTGQLGAVSGGAIALALGLEAAGRGDGWPTLGLLALAAAAEALRLWLWRSARPPGDGLLGMLHLGYAWLPAGLALVALARLGLAPLSEGDALHALAAGALACTIYAVAARAVARRADRLRTAALDLAGFGCLWLAALLRVFGPMVGLGEGLAPSLWCAGWALFVARHLAALTSPVPHPVFSGPRG